MDFLNVISVWLYISVGTSQVFEKLSTVEECTANLRGFSQYNESLGMFDLPKIHEKKCIVFRKGEYGNVEVQLIEN